MISGSFALAFRRAARTCTTEATGGAGGGRIAERHRHRRDRWNGDSLAERAEGRRPVAFSKRCRGRRDHRGGTRTFEPDGSLRESVCGQRAHRAAGAGATGRCGLHARFDQYDTGPNEGANTLLEFSTGPDQPHLAAADHIRLSRQVIPGGATTYAFYDFERAWPLLGLAAAFAVLVIAVARWRGLRALVGILVAFVVLVVFLLPALRDGAPAMPVALITSAAIRTPSSTSHTA